MKYLILLALFVIPAAAVAQNQTEIESNLQQAITARYRLTTVGPSAFGLRGADDSIRKMGGTLLVLKKGLYGSQERRNITSNSIKDGQRTLLSGKDDVELLPGERFFVTSVRVGRDFVSVGVLSVDPRSSNGRMARLWSALNFFFDPSVISAGDLNQINATMDQWIVPADSLPATSQSAIATRAPMAVPMASVELKTGASREQVESTIGKPIQAVAFEKKLWLAYPALVAVLEDGKLVAVDRVEQAFGNLSLTAEAGAEIYIDSELAGTTPTTLRVPTGSHKVELKQSGKSVWAQQVHVYPGADVNLKPPF